MSFDEYLNNVIFECQDGITIYKCAEILGLDIESVRADYIEEFGEEEEDL